MTATVERYNELYDKGVDEDFGKEAHRMSALRTAPFYGAKNCGYILCTMDGIQIDLNMNAVEMRSPACMSSVTTAELISQPPIQTCRQARPAEEP